MRAVASSTICFGLVSIPVKAYLAASPETFSFNMITPAGNRVKQKLVDAITGEEVERKNTLKGYEIEKDKFITFTDEELKSLEGEKSNTMEITEVVDFRPAPHQIEKAYYLAPDKNGDKSYRLLIKALEKTNSSAICKWYSRGKDNLIALVPVGDVLMMFQLYYADELRDFSPTLNAKSEPSDKEVDLACKLLGQLTSPEFKLDKYKNEYVERLRTAIARKQSGAEVKVENKSDETPSLDLEALLIGSLK